MLNKIIEWPDNPRKTRDDGAVDEAARSILARGLMRHDARTSILENLQPINVIGVIVRDHHRVDWCRGDFANLNQQTPRQLGRTQGIDQDHAFGRDHKARIRDEVLIGR